MSQMTAIVNLKKRTLGYPDQMTVDMMEFVEDPITSDGGLVELLDDDFPDWGLVKEGEKFVLTYAKGCGPTWNRLSAFSWKYDEILVIFRHI